MSRKMMSLGILAVMVMATSAGAKELAKVNGKAITDQDVRTALGSLNEGQRNSLLRDTNTRRQLLMNLIEAELLTQQGEKDKLDQDAQYKAALEQFRRQYLATRVLERNIGNKLTDAAAKAYYQRHTDRFSTDSVRVQHILVNDEKAARDVLQQVKAEGADFLAIAEKTSRDPSAKNNRGEIGWITRDAPLVAEFKDAAFNTKAGDIVGPVKTLFGYHIIKVAERKIGKPLSYDEVELKVKNELREELARDYIAGLRKQAKVQVDDKAVDTL
jgi:peptidyl-prolyl cis-trans isomerase C